MLSLLDFDWSNPNVSRVIPNYIEQTLSSKHLLSTTNWSLKRFSDVFVSFCIAWLSLCCGNLNLKLEKFLGIEARLLPDNGLPPIWEYYGK